MTPDIEYAEKLLDRFSSHALWNALQAIVDHPQQELRVETPYVNVGQAHAMDASLLGLSAAQPGSLANTSQMAHFKNKNIKWRFLNVYDRRIVRYDNTIANRFAAYFVRYAIRLLRPIVAMLSQDDEASEMVPEFLRIIGRLNGVLSQMPESFKYASLDEMPIDHPFLQFDPRYHIILKTYLECENG
jgi:hypothetical protein